MPKLSIKHWLGIGVLGLMAVLFIFSKSKAPTAVKASAELPNQSSTTETPADAQAARRIVDGLNQDLDRAKQEEAAKGVPLASVQPQNQIQLQNAMQAQQMQQMLAQQAYMRAMSAPQPRPEVEEPIAQAEQKSFVMSFKDETQAPIVSRTDEAKVEPKEADGSFACGSEENYWSACIPEGTVIETALNNVLQGDFTGPVITKVTQSLMSLDKKHVLVPAGTVVLGESGRVEGQDQSRLAIGFHRMILSDGAAYHRAGWAISLDKLQGLSMDGSAGEKGKVNHHIPSMIAASAAYGLLAGFSLSGTGSYINGSGTDMYRQGISQSMGQQGQMALSRLMNRMPTITVPVGSECEVYIAADIRMRQ